MTKTIIKSRLLPNKNTNKIKPELKENSSILPPNFQSFKQQSISRNGFLVYKWDLKFFNQ